MASAILTSGVNIAGLSISSAASRSGEGVIGQDVALAAGTAGTLTTRTDNDTGVATLNSGHGLQSLDVCDVFWDGGARHGMTATVAGDAITLDGGAGDNLPAQDTAVVVCIQTVVDIDFDGDLVQMLVLSSTGRLGANLIDDAAASALLLDIPANELWSWLSDQGIANPIAGDTIASIAVSNGSTSAATLKIGVIYDSVA